MILLTTNYGDIKLELDYDKHRKPPRILNSTFAMVFTMASFFTV